jgi:glycosyltransferase involved in cell wall biosynthesis
MRVLLISGSYPPMKCGVGDYTYQLAEALAASSDIHVGVLTSQAAAQAVPTRVQVLNEMPGWSLREARHAIRTLRSWRPDVVHVQFPTQGYGYGRLPILLPLIARLLGVKLVQTWHESTSLRGAASFLLRAIAPGRVVVVRPGFREALHPVLRAMLFLRAPVFIANASAIPKSRLDARQQQEAKRTYLAGQQRLIVFFGFVYPFKGVDLLFEIADASTDRIIIAGELDRETDYGRRLLEAATSAPWAGKIDISGFLPSETVADLLIISDAVVLPFRCGGGEWNTSIHGAIVNDAYVITTSKHRRGFDEQSRVHYSPIDDVADMKIALSLCERRRRRSPVADNKAIDGNSWQSIACSHADLYRGIVGRRASWSDG